MKTYIQIGTNVGNDDFQKMVEGLQEACHIVLIEPNEDLLKQIEESYRGLSHRHKISIFSYAISTSDGEADFHFYWNSELTTLINRKTTGVGPSKIKKVKTITFNHLCSLIKTNEIHHLSIDAEGMDYLILNSIDLIATNINEIVFEEWWPENDDKNGIYETGPKLLDGLKEKYKNYIWERVQLNNMQNFRLTKKQ
jgi:FkbM family methyltransferase